MKISQLSGNMLIVLILFCFSIFVRAAEPVLIDISDRADIASRGPILIAHRGGVITPDSHECSLSALRLAAVDGYDMVELDVQMSSDGVPIVFHDRTLEKACGINGHVIDFSANELQKMRYLIGDDGIVSLERSLETCQRLGLGVMLDLKAGQDSREFLERINDLIFQYGLSKAAISFSGSDTARRFLTHVHFTPTDEEMLRLQAGEDLNLSHSFWFGLPNQLLPGDIARLKSSGALVFPAINTFRYPTEGHFNLAQNDIRRLIEEGVDGFQIDSIYFPIFNEEKVNKSTADETDDD